MNTALKILGWLVGVVVVMQFLMPKLSHFRLGTTPRGPIFDLGYTGPQAH
ncbi:MAG: hypothetical protein ACREQ5_17700 [Candidatus Dormibacteria bacterium]